MVVGLMAMAAVCADQSHVTLPPTLSAEELGRRRDSFGPHSVLEGHLIGYPSSLYAFVEARPTEIVFPQGKWDERFLISEFAYKTPRTGTDRTVLVLVYETKRAGKINLEWMIPLRLTVEKDVKALFANFEPRGSMTRYLLFDGLKPQGHLSKRIRNRLNVREGYASYCAGNVIRGKFSYWFTDKLGFSSEHQIIDIDDLRRRAKNLRSMSSPGIAPPYPITKEEIAASRLR